jgi:hypothetical protein
MEAPVKTKWICLFIFTILLFASPVRADTQQFDVNVTGSTDTQVCAALHDGCPAITFSFDFQTIAAIAPPYGNVMDVETFSGEINGQPISGSGGRGWLFDEFNYVPYQVFSIFSVNEEDGLNAVVDGVIVNWNVTVTPIAAPEPSSLALLAIGLVILLKYGNRSRLRNRHAYSV